MGDTYPIVPVAGLVPATWVGSFFAIQRIALLIEARRGVRRWPPLPGRAVTIFVFAMSAPLFAEGFVRGVRGMGL